MVKLEGLVGVNWNVIFVSCASQAARLAHGELLGQPSREMA